MKNKNVMLVILEKQKKWKAHFWLVRNNLFEMLIF